MFLNATAEYFIKKNGKTQKGKVITNTASEYIFNVPAQKLDKIQIKFSFDKKNPAPKVLNLSINQYLLKEVKFEYLLKDKTKNIYQQENFNSLLTHMLLREGTSELIIRAKNVYISKESNMRLFENYVEY